MKNKYDLVIVGGGYSGLTIAYRLSNYGFKIAVVEKEETLGGLAGTYHVGETELEKFYHHLFTSDNDILNLVAELGIKSKIQKKATNTGMYYANKFYKLSSPKDLLRFKPLPLIDRLRLGLLIIKARSIKNWKSLESKSAKQWLIENSSIRVYKIVWEPLLVGKFGRYADSVSAVWIWNKLVLRGGSRDRGEEKLVYFKGGFQTITTALESKLRSTDIDILKGTAVHSINRHGDAWQIDTNRGTIEANFVCSTLPLPLIAQHIRPFANFDLIARLNRIKYVGNTCLVLELTRSLSSTYWLNVNDANFPFVGIIEHTNFDALENYSGRHIVYLSKYLPTDDSLYHMSADELYDYAYPFIKRMFPEFDNSWVLNKSLWKAQYSQPIVEKAYSTIIPSNYVVDERFAICSMAQIYPQDRGTNYAVMYANKMAESILCKLRGVKNV